MQKLEQKIDNYFKVYALIELFFEKQVGNNNIEYWDINFTNTFEVFVIAITKEEQVFSLDAISKHLEQPFDVIKDFYEVHAWLSNNLYDLIKENKYKAWNTISNNIQVTFNDNSVKNYSSSELAKAIERVGINSLEEMVDVLKLY